MAKIDEPKPRFKIPLPRYMVPSFEVEDVVHSLGKLEYVADKNNLEETRKGAEKIREKLQSIYPEAAVMLELLLEYLESHDKIGEHCLKIISKLRELVRVRYFRL